MQLFCFDTKNNNKPYIMKLKFKIHILLALLLSFAIISCKDNKNDEDNDPSESKEAKHTNEWILGQMKTYYYWNTKLPPAPNLKETDTEYFFNSLLYNIKSIDGDRFSTIEEDFNKNTSKATATNQLGFDFIIKSYFKENPGSGVYSSVGFFITHVRENSGAWGKLNRGDIIYAIDSEEIVMGNYEDMYYFLQETSCAKLSTYDKTGKTHTVELKGSNTYDRENPIWICKTVEKDNVKVGYILYDKFNRGKEDDENSYVYDIKLVEEIGKFYNQGIKNIVIDLRYNPGGLVTSAINLASALVPDRKESNVFAVSEYNSNLSKRYNPYDYFADYVYKGNERKKAENRLAEIPKTNFDRLYILATGNSASASELTIAALRPYMGSKLKHIGTTTVGKDKGSFTLETDDKDIKWILHPLVSRIENSDGSVKNYTGGLRPDITVDEWEDGFLLTAAKTSTKETVLVPTLSSSNKGWFQLGDPNETLLAAAFDDITGKTTRKSAVTETTKTTSVIVPELKKMRSEVMWITKQEAENE